MTIHVEEEQDALAQLITHKEAHLRCYGRLVATGITSIMTDWLTQELKRGAKASDQQRSDIILEIMRAMINVHVSLVASVVAQTSHERGDREIADLITKLTNEQLIRSMPAVRAKYEQYRRTQ